LPLQRCHELLIRTSTATVALVDVLCLCVVEEVLLDARVNEPALAVESAPLLDLLDKIGAETFELSDSLAILLPLQLEGEQVGVHRGATGAVRTRVGAAATVPIALARVAGGAARV